MHSIFRTAIAAAVIGAAAHANAGIRLFEDVNFSGRSYVAEDALANFQNIDFNDRASSIVVTGRAWEVCEDAGFRGRCVVLRPGNYASLSDMGLQDRISSAREVRGNGNGNDLPPGRRWGPPPRAAAVTLFQDNDFRGPRTRLEGDVRDFQRIGFNDRASSVEVVGQPFEFCSDADFRGRCVVLRPGRYPDLGSMGLNDQVSSARLVPVERWPR